MALPFDWLKLVAQSPLPAEAACKQVSADRKWNPNCGRWNSSALARPAGLPSHRLKQSCRSLHLHHPIHVVHEDMQAHFNPRFRERFRQEVCRAHPCVERAK